MIPDNIDWFLCSTAADASRLDVAWHCNTGFLRWTRRLRHLLLVLMPLALIIVVAVTYNVLPDSRDKGHLANWRASYSELSGNIDHIFVQI